MSPESKLESAKVETKVTDWQSVSTEELVEIKVRPQVMREVILALQANLHQSNANTKRRGEVRGGGKKPWRQKGTGRARVGSSRTPVWRGGGVVFGPLNIKNYQQKLTSTLRRQALASVLRLKIKQGKVAIWNLTTPITKTKEVVKQMPQLVVVSPTLVILPDASYKNAFRNLPNVSTSSVTHINALDIAGSRQIVFLGDTFEQIKAKILS